MAAPESKESQFGTSYEHPGYTPLILVQDLTCRVAECFCFISHWVSGLSRNTSSDSSSDSELESEQSVTEEHDFSQAQGLPYNRESRGIHSVYPNLRSGESLMHVHHSGYIPYRPDRILAVTNMVTELNAVPSESSSGISTIITFSTCPVIPELEFTRFELDHFADIPPSELAETWQSLVDDLQNAASQDSDESTTSVEISPRGLSRPISPSSIVEELFFVIPRHSSSSSSSPSSAIT